VGSVEFFTFYPLVETRFKNRIITGIKKPPEFMARGVFKG